MIRDRRGGYARLRCPIRPTTRILDLPPHTIACGHCDGYIEAGMEIGHCPIHRWLCPECIHHDR